MSMDKRLFIRNHCDECACNGCVFYPDKEAWCTTKNLTELTDDEVNEIYNKLNGIEEPEVSENQVTNDVVNHPSHYCQGGMECIDEMVLLFGREVVKHFCLCNAWKYRKRAMYKNGQEDMDKADWYIKKYDELENQLEVQTLGQI